MFKGELDTKTLGGAGFASQCTIESLTYDLSAYDGLEIALGKVDEGAASEPRKVVLLVKDSIEQRRPDGRMESGVNWEWTFEGAPGSVLQAGWKDFKPTYRGRDIDTPEGGLKTGEIKRIGLMMRSFFDAQSGPFSIPIVSIAAIKTSSSVFQPALAEGMKAEKVMSSTTDGTMDDAETKNHVWTEEERKIQKKMEKKAEMKRRTEERNQRTGIGALTGEMRDRGEGGQDGWRGWFNWIGRC